MVLGYRRIGKKLKLRERWIELIKMHRRLYELLNSMKDSTYMTQSFPISLW